MGCQGSVNFSCCFLAGRKQAEWGRSAGFRGVRGVEGVQWQRVDSEVPQDCPPAGGAT